jgi:hypothetical protein
MKKYLFLVLSVTAACITTYFLVEFIRWDAGELTAMNALKFNWVNFFRAGFANPAASFITVDVITGVICFSALVWMDASTYRMKYWWVYIVLVFAVGYAFAFPFYLFMRQRAAESPDRGITPSEE